MERREAIQALIGLPAVSRIARADIQPGEAIIVECQCRVTPEMVNYIVEQLQGIWPGHKVVVLEERMRIRFAKA